MRLLLLFASFLLFIANVASWNLNDLYKQLVGSNRKKQEDLHDIERHHHNSNAQLAETPPGYEVQSYNVEASNPAKKSIRNRPVHEAKPTEPVPIYSHKEKSMVNFLNKYGLKKAKGNQVRSHEHAIKKQNAFRPNKLNSKGPAPTAPLNVYEQHPMKKDNHLPHKEVKVTQKNTSEHEISQPLKTATEQFKPQKEELKLELAKNNKSVHNSDQPADTSHNLVHSPKHTLCKPTPGNPCPTAPLMIDAARLSAPLRTDTNHFESLMLPSKPKISKIADLNPIEHRGGEARAHQGGETREDTTKPKKIEEAGELPHLKKLLLNEFTVKIFTLGDCKIKAVSSVCGAKLAVDKDTCDGKVSFTALLQRLLGEVDLATPSNKLIVHGKFEVSEFSIQHCNKGLITFNLKSQELLDIIPNKLRLSKATVITTFTYDQIPQSIHDFDLKIDGTLDLNFRNRRLSVSADKPFGTALYTISMTTTDLELPEFTKLFTDDEIPQQDLPPDLATLVTSSLRNPRITGLYDESGAFEFVASAKSPASIFPSQPTIYVVIQKPRFGKVVCGLIAYFVGAMYRPFLSSILNQDLSNLPLFTDARTDMAIGISPDGLFVVKDELFNKEVGSLFNTGKTIRKGLTVKARLPVRNMFQYISKKSEQMMPETVLINVEVKNNKMHIEFPDDFQVPMSKISELFSQKGQDLNFPKQTNIDHTPFFIKSYDVDDVDKKTISANFGTEGPMKIGSLMQLNNVGATLKRDELSKWSFVASGDYNLGRTPVAISLKSQNDGFVISSTPSSIRSEMLVELLDQKRDMIKPEINKHHLEDFVIEDFKVAGVINKKNTIRFSGKPTVFGVDDAKIEFVASEDGEKEDALAMGLLFKNVNMDTVFGRMLDRKMQRSSWANGVNIGLILSTPRPGADLKFESEGLARTTITPGAHIRVLLMRPDATLCKGDSLCRVLSEEMPHGSAFHLAGEMKDGAVKLNAPINDAISLSRSLKLNDASLEVQVKDSVDIFVLANLMLKGIGIPFQGDMRVDNTGQLQLNMAGKRSWEKPFGLKNVHFQQNNITATFEPGQPVPTFEMRSKITFGKDPKDLSKSLEATALSKINTQDPSKNSFVAHMRDLSFEKLASACGTKRPLNRFQQEARFMEEGILSFDQTNKDTRSTIDNSTEPDYDYKGDLKLTGRMNVLGQNSEYTIKFLHQQNQLLTEVWLPDVGVDQGILTIRAGLKHAKRDSDAPAPNGPTLLVRMDPYMNSAVIVGKVATLGFSRLSAIKVEDSGLSAKIYGNLPGNVNSDLALHSDYVDNIQNANFQVSSCLPLEKGVKSALTKSLQNTATKTKKTLISAEDRVTTTEKIYETTKSMIDKNRKRSDELTSDIRQRAEIMATLRKGIKKHCVKDCGDSCMGLPSWKKSGIKMAGRDVIGSPTWESCRRKIPDLNCITRCLGRKVIQNVKANNKQYEMQGLMGSLADTKRSLQNSRTLVDRARKLVDSTLDGLEKVNNEIKVGVDISKYLNDGRSDENFAINNICFKDSLTNAERSLVNFQADIKPANETAKKFSIMAALDGNLDESIAEGVANQIYPGYFEFSKKLEQVKVLLSGLDGEKSEIQKAIDKSADDLSQTDQRSQVVWNNEEEEFRKLAYGELPRFTLSDDETIHAFQDKSIWEIAPSNNPLFENTQGELSSKFGGKHSFTDDLEKQSDCGRLRSSVNRYGDIINPLSEFTENFLQEKIMFYRQKNRRLADLRMIDDQIKSDCFLENCTMEDMGNALSYLARARDGTLKWSTVIENQIESQNKAALGYFSKRTSEIIEADKGVTLRQYIIKVKDVARKAIKKSSIPKKSETDEKIQKLAKELHSLLIGVKSSEELSTVAPRIFSMKREIQDLKRNKIPCKEDTKSKGDSMPPSDILEEEPTKKSATQKSQPVKTQNAFVKNKVPTYQNGLVAQNMKQIKTMPVRERITEAELIDPPQNVPSQYTFRNDQPSYQMYQPTNYWEGFLK